MRAPRKRLRRFRPPRGSRKLGAARRFLARRSDAMSFLESLSADRLDEPSEFVPCEFRVQWAATRWELDSAMALRRAVFCVEQGIFPGDDRDVIDDHAQLFV